MTKWIPKDLNFLLIFPIIFPSLKPHPYRPPSLTHILYLRFCLVSQYPHEYPSIFFVVVHCLSTNIKSVLTGQGEKKTNICWRR